MNTETPRTDKAEYTVRLGVHKRKVVRPELCRELERELTAVTKQRDRLAESLRKFVGDALFRSHADTNTDVLAHQQVDDSGDALTMP